MAVTLNEMLKAAKTDYGAMVIKDLIRMSKLLTVLRFKDVSGLRVVGHRWQTLPATGKRKLGGGYTEATGTLEPVEETLSIYGGDIQIDRIFTKVQSLFMDQLALQTEMLRESIARSVHNDIINGDHAVDVDGFEGLKKRVSNMPARLTINLESGGNSLAVLTNTTNGHLFLDALHKAKKYVGGRVDFWLCSEASELGIGQLYRRQGLLTTTQDAMERTWESILGGAIIDVGLKQDLSTEIMPSTEGTDSLGNSLYAVRAGDEEGLNGIQLAGTSPEPYDPLAGGELTSTPAYMRRVDWAIGLKNMSQNFSICRVTGFRWA